MRVLAFDPGATRMGFSILEKEDQEQQGNKGLKYHGSGYSGLERLSNGSKREPYQKYRLRLIALWVEEAIRLLKSYKPDVVVNEIVPVVGGGNFVIATQSQLASTAITTVQAIAIDRGYKIEQIGATTAKARIGGSKKATKPKVRDGVLKLLPQLEHRRKEWTGAKAVWDEPDALAIGLTHLGCRHG